MLYLVSRNWSRLRYGVLFIGWMGWYGLQRFLIDFTRNTDFGSETAAGSADATLGPLTWSQWSGLTIGVLAVLVVIWISIRAKTPVASPEQDQRYGAEPASVG